jgi:uncharacterized protein
LAREGEAVSIQTKDDIWRRLRLHQDDLQEFGVKQLGLFGSFRRNEGNEQSDVDIFVVFEAGQKTFNNFMDLCFFLEELFEREVDVVTLESLSQHLKQKILKEVEFVPLF